jgi:hypothetical protein
MGIIRPVWRSAYNLAANCVRISGCIQEDDSDGQPGVMNPMLVPAEVALLVDTCWALIR